MVRMILLLLFPNIDMALDPEFFESRAILFSKMGQHKQALEVYVFKLQDHAKAEEYVYLFFFFFFFI